MPGYKDSLCFENLFSLDNMLFVEVSFMSDLSSHVINQEWLTHIVLVVSIWHCLEVDCHQCSSLNISKFVMPSCGVTVSVEELSKTSSVFREVRILSSSFPFLVVVHHVVSLRREKLLNFLVLEQSIQYVYFINLRFHSSVSDSSGSHEREENEMELVELGYTDLLSRRELG